MTAAAEHEFDAAIAEAWPAAIVDRDRVPGWELRSTFGVTRRANSVRFLATVDDPAAALAEASAWFRSAGANPTALISDQSPGGDAVREIAAADSGREISTTVVLSMPIVVEAPTDSSGTGVARRDELDEAWFETHLALGGRGDTPDVRRALAHLLRPGRPTAYLRIDLGSSVVGVAQVVAVDRLAVVQCVAVDPSYRRQGHARRLMLAGLDAAASLGADALVIAVEADNTAARRLYDDLGAIESHRYRYVEWN